MCMSALQTGKLCYNAINYINYVLSCACVCAELQESSISRLSWSFVKEFAVSSGVEATLSCALRISQQSCELQYARG